MEETEDPELAFGRVMATYLKKGYSKEWKKARVEIEKQTGKLVVTDKTMDNGKLRIENGKNGEK